MRPIATLAPAPLRFPDAPRRLSDAVVASPGQRLMQHLLPGYDLTVGPDVRGRFMVRLRRPPRGQSAEHQGADAAGGGDCRRAAGQAGGDDGASGGVITRRPDDWPLANFRISTKTLWSVVRWASRQTGAPGVAARALSPGERRNSRISTKTLWSAVRSAWRQAGTPGVADRGLSAGERCNSRISTKTPWSAGQSAWRQAGTPERRPRSRPQATGQSGERRTRGRSAGSLSLRYYGANRKRNPLSRAPR